MEAKLKLNDILKLSEEELSRTRIRFNRYNGEDNPIDIYVKAPEKLLDWNYHNNKTYKENQISIGFVDMGNDRWLLFTVGLIIEVYDHVIKFSGNSNSGVQVKYETLSRYQPLYGRLVINYHNKSQQLFRNAVNLIDDLVVSEYLPKVYDDFEFPGYDNVCLSFEKLKLIIDCKSRSYESALKNQKAVYLITDTFNGKLYVGSSRADECMLFERWSAYANNGHGGNKELKAIVEEKGFDYIKKYFQYSILENYNSTKDDDYILKRENHWKEVLNSKVPNGYNWN